MHETKTWKKKPSGNQYQLPTYLLKYFYYTHLLWLSSLNKIYFFFKFYISNVSLFMFYFNMFLFSLKKSLGKVIFQIPFERFREMEISMLGATLKQLDPYVVH